MKKTCVAVNNGNIVPRTLDYDSTATQSLDDIYLILFACDVNYEKYHDLLDKRTNGYSPVDTLVGLAKLFDLPPPTYTITPTEHRGTFHCTIKIGGCSFTCPVPRQTKHDAKKV